MPAPAATRPAQHPSFDGCWHVFLDVGSNVGQQIQLLYEGNQSEGGGPVGRLFDRFFDRRTEKRQRVVCALGIEGNPHHTATLRALEAQYQARGWRASFLTETAAANDDGQATFYVDESPTGRMHNEWGSSLYSYIGNTRNRSRLSSSGTIEFVRLNGVGVATVDLTALISSSVLERVLPGARSSRRGELPPAVIMKLDIEGGKQSGSMESTVHKSNALAHCFSPAPLRIVPLRPQASSR